MQATKRTWGRLLTVGAVVLGIGILGGSAAVLHAQPTKVKPRVILSCQLVWQAGMWQCVIQPGCDPTCCRNCG